MTTLCVVINPKKFLSGGTGGSAQRFWVWVLFSEMRKQVRLRHKVTSISHFLSGLQHDLDGVFGVVHQLEGLIVLVKGEAVRDNLIDRQAAFH